MWSILSGTIVNVAAVAVGSAVGLTISGTLPERYRLIVLQCLGLVTVTLGVDAGVLKFSETVAKYAPQMKDSTTYGARLAMVVIGSLLIGAVIGTALRLHERVESLGGWIHRRFAGGDGGRFAEGFLTASVIFCVGPLTLIGCLENGARSNPSFLYIKSLLDGFCSLALASSLGWGVFASVATVGVFQGGLALLAYWAAEPLDPLSIGLMSTVGGIILLATALMILDLKRIPVANMLPGVFLPPLIVWAAQHLAPGLLLPQA
jgi:uncharacterized membrane protein YqgA involved in biofilm formation